MVHAVAKLSRCTRATFDYMGHCMVALRRDTIRWDRYYSFYIYFSYFFEFESYMYIVKLCQIRFN